MLTIQIYEKDIDLEEKNKEGETRGEKSYNKFTEMNEGETRNRKKIMKYRIKKLESEKSKKRDQKAKRERIRKI